MYEMLFIVINPNAPYCYVLPTFFILFLHFLSLCYTCAATFFRYFRHIMLICNYDHLWYLSVRFPGLVSCCLVFDRRCPDPVQLLLSPDLGLRRWPSPFPIPVVSYGDLPSGPLPVADCHSWHSRSAIAATRRSSSGTVEALHYHWRMFLP
jgi:hypothetical protein